MSRAELQRTSHISFVCRMHGKRDHTTHAEQHRTRLFSSQSIGGTSFWTTPDAPTRRHHAINPVANSLGLERGETLIERCRNCSEGCVAILHVLLYERGDLPVDLGVHQDHSYLTVICYRDTSELPNFTNDLGPLVLQLRRRSLRKLFERGHEVSRHFRILGCNRGPGKTPTIVGRRTDALPDKIDECADHKKKVNALRGFRGGSMRRLLGVSHELH